VREFVKKRELQRSETSVEAIIVAALSFVEHEAARAQIHLEHKCDSSPTVMADFVAIEQVILNLIRNSFDVLKSADSGNRRLTIRAAPDGDSFVRVEVRDNGPGMPASVLARLFEPFVTTKADGMGLGLSICRGIVVSHGGTIEVVSSEKGCLVWFTLPVASARATP
jgi:two-component system sensor kinase FixL